jgi:very-short-patch-repair endonuclease
LVSERARTLRKNPTDAEIRLWSKLRHKQIEGFRFRRQRPVGPYIVDFICLNSQPIIEVDGGQHNEPSEYETRRTQYLENEGFRILRFWNIDVLANTDGVLEVIRGALLEE